MTWKNRGKFLKSATHCNKSKVETFYTLKHKPNEYYKNLTNEMHCNGNKSNQDWTRMMNPINDKIKLKEKIKWLKTQRFHTFQ